MNFYKETDFQESIIGKYPKDWAIARIDKKFDTSSGGTPDRQRKEYYKGTIPWVKSGELKDKVILGTEEKITEEGFKNSAAKLFPNGTLLVAMYGATVGKTGILGIDATTNQAVCALLPKEKDVDINYLKHSLVSIRNRWIFQSAGGAQPNISQDIIRSSRIPFPPYKEQQHIAGVLGVVDSALELSDQIIAKTERLKRGLMQQLLTRGIGHTETKQTPIGNIPKDWETISLSKVFKLSSGKPRPANISEEASPEAPYPIYGGNGVLGYSSKFLLNHQTIVIGRVGEYCGAVYKSSERSWITDNALYATELSNDFEITFLKYLLSFMNLNKFQKKMGQPLITQTILYGIDVPRPPLPEQLKIVDVLSTADRKLELENKERLRLETIKRGLMDLLLTGKVRIKVD